MQRPALTAVTMIAVCRNAGVKGLAQRPGDIARGTKAPCRCAPAAAAPDELPLITARQAQQRSSVVVSHHTSKGRDVGPVRDTPVLLLRKLLCRDPPTALASPLHPTRSTSLHQPQLFHPSSASPPPGHLHQAAPPARKQKLSHTTRATRSRGEPASFVFIWSTGSSQLQVVSCSSA